jgi:D-alanyl-D-alanine carboxypeptidase
MNEEAKAVGMKKSNFAVAHGMWHEMNYSSALDMGKLCISMMKDETFT